MRKRGLTLRSSSMANLIPPTDPRAGSKQRKEDQEEFEEQKRQTRCATKREARLRKRVKKQAKVITPSHEAQR